jgi:aminoglycoside phosphotransferase family enzyme/predicted kinase
MIVAASQRLLSFLSDAASYAHHPPQVRLVQTHASWVVIAPPFVYKIKKPVDLGFLDFSSLELRHADCERELVLNRRLAEDVYIGLEPICERDGCLHWGGDGVIIEWALKMREMDGRYFLIRLIKDHAVDKPEMDRLVEKLLHFYSAQPPLAWSMIKETNGHLRRSCEDNFHDSRSFIGQSVSIQVLDAIAHYTRRFFDRHGTLLESRLHDHWIRDCHGDLHLEHIHLAPDAVRIYDCIEFNNDFRCIDVACDIAFLAMDLDFNDRRDLSRYIVDRFALLLEDRGMKPLMDFYKCYRACVRGKVESLHANAETVGDAEKEACLHLARRYFHLALQYAVAGSLPRVFVFMGKVASGKSALAEALGREMDWPVLSSDRLRKSLAGTPVHHRGNADERAALYGQEMTRLTYEQLFEQAFASLRGGHGIILDATFSKKAHRDALKASLKAEGFEVLWIEARASESIIRERLQDRDQGVDVVSDARLEDYKRLSAGYEAPDELLPVEKVCLSTDGPLDEVFASLLSELVMR